jgi:hypothetical protein
MATFQELVEFFKGEKALEVEHTDGSYLGHCASVYRDMKRWGADEELAQAGFFHSVYGTVLFQKFKLELEDFNDLVFLQLCDRLEQIPRSKAYAFRQPSFERMAAWLAERTNGIAPAAYERVYAEAGAC